MLKKNKNKKTYTLAHTNKQEINKLYDCMTLEYQYNVTTAIQQFSAATTKQCMYCNMFSVSFGASL